MEPCLSFLLPNTLVVLALKQFCIAGMAEFGRLPGCVSSTYLVIGLGRLFEINLLYTKDLSAAVLPNWVIDLPSTWLGFLKRDSNYNQNVIESICLSNFKTGDVCNSQMTPAKIDSSFHEALCILYKYSELSIKGYL